MSNTDINERKRVSGFHFWVGAILLAVCFWDIFVLKVSSWPYYYPFKVSAFSLYFILSYLVQKDKLKPSHCCDISFIYFYLYSYIATSYLHSSYIFSFYEGLAFFSFVYIGIFPRAALLTVFGVTLALLSISQTPEPDGMMLRQHLYIVTVIFGILTLVAYWIFNRQREIIYQQDQKFASIGRQSAFLLHELKSPLSRFMSSSSEKDNHDADYIFSIIEGVELLITKKENLNFGKLCWADIGKYLSNEFGPVCDHYKIKLEIIGFESEGFGHRSTIRLALKNLVKNAVEAIASEGSAGTIKVSRMGNTIEVANNGSVITKEKIEQLFTPFVSGKNTKTNYGIGLHFVDSVVKAHNGNIGVNVENGWNIFTIKLGEMS